MERLKFDAVVAEQALVVAEAVQQLSLGEPPATLAEAQCRGGDALCIGPDTIGTGKFAFVTFHLALLTQYARKHSLRLRSLREGAICGRQRRGRGASL